MSAADMAGTSTVGDGRIVDRAEHGVVAPEATRRRARRHDAPASTPAVVRPGRGNRPATIPQHGVEGRPGAAHDHGRMDELTPSRGAGPAITASRTMRAEAAQFVRFCVVGGTNTLLTLATFALLTGAGLSPAPASGLGYALGAANGYVLNRSWTFRSSRRGARMIARYLAVQTFGAGCSAAFVGLASADLSLRRLAAECMVLPFVTAMTYTLSRRLVFRAAGAPLTA
jgi:putative flippase GtrA